MFPHRMLSSELCRNGLKDRVTACRKRLRVSRVAQKGQVNDDAEQLLSETISVSRVDDHAAGNPLECPTMLASVVRVNYRCSNAVAEPGKSETLLLVGQQEVGIT